MIEKYTVRLEKECHVFSAAHFITYDGDVCEPLHGHNYRVWVEVEGVLDQNHYVVDFIALREGLKEITDSLDHHVLLPTTHPLIRVNETETEVEVTFKNRRWVFPLDGCILLPVANTTAELLARHIGMELLERLRQRGLPSPDLLRVAVDEQANQWGICELRNASPPDR